MQAPNIREIMHIIEQEWSEKMKKMVASILSLVVVCGLFAVPIMAANPDLSLGVRLDQTINGNKLYANGESIIIQKDPSNSNNVQVYNDLNKNGVPEEDELCRFQNGSSVIDSVDLHSDYASVYGGGYDKDVDSTNIKVLSGEIRLIMGDGRNANAVRGDINIEIANASVSQVVGAGIGGYADVNGDINILIENSGITFVDGIHYELNRNEQIKAFNGDINITVDNSASNKEIRSINGAWLSNKNTDDLNFINAININVKGKNIYGITGVILGREIPTINKLTIKVDGENSQTVVNNGIEFISVPNSSNACSDAIIKTNVMSVSGNVFIREGLGGGVRLDTDKNEVLTVERAITRGNIIHITLKKDSTDAIGKKIVVLANGVVLDSSQFKLCSNQGLALNFDDKGNLIVASDQDPIKYSVSANDVKNGTVRTNPTYAYADETITVTPVPDKGYRFKEGSLKQNGKTIEKVNGVYQFKMPAKSVAITATFEKISGNHTPSPTKSTADTAEEYYTVSFDSQGGTKIAELEITANTGFDRFQYLPEKAGYAFGGWYTDKDCKNRFLSNTLVTEDITLYAYWLETEEKSMTTTNPQTGDSWWKGLLF